jgi:hypothetical protein
LQAPSGENFFEIFPELEASEERKSMGLDRRSGAYLSIFVGLVGQSFRGGFQEPKTEMRPQNRVRHIKQRAEEDGATFDTAKLGGADDTGEGRTIVSENAKSQADYWCVLSV